MLRLERDSCVRSAGSAAEPQDYESTSGSSSSGYALWCREENDMSASLGNDDMSLVVSSPSEISNPSSSGASSPTLGMSPEIKAKVPSERTDFEIDVEVPAEISVQIASKFTLGICTTRSHPYPDVSAGFSFSKFMALQWPASCNMQ